MKLFILIIILNGNFETINGFKSLKACNRAGRKIEKILINEERASYYYPETFSFLCLRKGR